MIVTTYLFVVPIMIEANRFLLIYNPGFDFAHYILHKIEKKVNTRWTLNIQKINTKIKSSQILKVKTILYKRGTKSYT